MLDQFKNQVWITRVSRVNAEKRLLRKKNFTEFINIYYSCIMIIFSIFSIIYESSNLSLVSLVMSICLLVAILYVNNQNYFERARKFRENYTKLQNIEFQLSRLNEEDTDSLYKLQEEYCNLLDLNENHISFDYICTMYRSNINFRIKRNFVGCSSYLKYYWGWLWRCIFCVIIIILPWTLSFLLEILVKVF